MESSKLTSLFREEFRRCKVKESETAIVLSGERSRPEYAQAALSALSELGARAFQMHMPPVRSKGPSSLSSVGLTPVSEQRLAVETLKKADFVVDLLFLLHSPEQGEILKAGTRVLLVVEPPEILERLLPTEQLRQEVELGAKALKEAKALRVTSPTGTDLRMELGDFPVITQYGLTDEPGRWDHWPSSFLYTWPNEGSAAGKVVLGSGDFIWPLNRYVVEPIHLTVDRGYIREITGGPEASFLREQMESFQDPEAYAVSHIGWGIDPRAKWDAVRTQPESVGIDPRSYRGNVQFSTGPNTEAGGNRHTLGHFDMPLLGCTLTLDGKPVVVDGAIAAA